MADQTLDAKGLNCPLPILKAKKALKDVPDGGTLEILATDPGSVADFQAFCRTTGNELPDLLRQPPVEPLFRADIHIGQTVAHIDHAGDDAALVVLAQHDGATKRVAMAVDMAEVLEEAMKLGGAPKGVLQARSPFGTAGTELAAGNDQAGVRAQKGIEL